MAVSSVKSSTQPKKTEKKEEKKVEEQKTQAKSADLESTNPSERAKDIVRNEEIKDGVFKSRSDATLGDIAQANAMKEDGTVDPAEVKNQVIDMVQNNPELAAKAKEMGIDLENPTDDDLQKLANMDIKAGQEVKVGEKPLEEAKAPEEAAAEEAPAEEAGAEEAAPAEAAKGPEEAANDPISQIMALIEKAEASNNPGEKAQLANQAITMINDIRAQKGITKEQQQPQGNTTAGANQQAASPEATQLAQNIKAGGKIDQAALGKAMEGDVKDLAVILDSLEQRANMAKNGNNTTMNALNMLGQQAMGQMNAQNSIQLPYMNQAIA